MTKLIGFENSAPRPDDMVQVPLALFEAMHQKMAQLAEIEEAMADGVFDLNAFNTWQDKRKSKGETKC